MENLQDNLTGVNQEGFYPNRPLRYLTATSIVGDKVYNPAGEHLGVIKDIMIDLASGTIDYFIIEFGGFLGIGIKYFAIPFSLLKVDPDNKRFLFAQSKEELSKAPGFDIDHWPDTNIHLEEVNEYWNFMG
jgi:sporulation protein YlmC with PRC-barrel domain